MTPETPYRTRSERFGHPAGSIVYLAVRHDYGLASDDTRGTGAEHVSVTLDPAGGYPFFTIPISEIAPEEEDANG